MENNPLWKTNFDGRQPAREDDIIWKTTFDGRQPLMEDNLRWKKTFDDRELSMDDAIYSLLFGPKRNFDKKLFHFLAHKTSFKNWQNLDQ